MAVSPSLQRRQVQPPAVGVYGRWLEVYRASLSASDTMIDL